MTDYLPDVKEQRQMLINKRDSLRREGYALQIQYETYDAQELQGQVKTEYGVSTKKELLDMLKKASANAYAAARKMDELISRLPEEETTTQE